MNRPLAALLGFAVGGLLAVVGISAVDPQPPDCPTEDSCRPVYEQGSWSVVPDRP